MENRFKFRVWSKQSYSYIKENKFYIDKFGGLFKYEKSKSTVYINADSPYVMSLCSGYNYIVEQCTGLKDKNGKLIYEHDYVMINKIIYEVFWNKTKISLVNMLNGDIIDFIETEEMEIIGNEHEETNIGKI